MSTDIHRDAAIRMLADGFAIEFANYCAGDERMHNLMQHLASEFVADNIPIVEEDAATDVACELLMSVTVRTV